MLRAMRRTSRTGFSLILGIVCLGSCAGSPAEPGFAAGRVRFTPPPTRRDAIAETLHGVRVEDPYRWLEDQDSDEVAAWVRLQNEASRAFLDAIPEREAIRRRLVELWNYERFSAPRRAGERWIYSRNDGLQNQSVLWITGDPSRDGEVLFDPNTLSEDGTVALGAFEPDEQGRLAAYATSTSGSDWREWRVLDLATRRPLEDRLLWSKFSGAAWTKDGKGFFYQRYDAPEEGEVYEGRNRAPKLCYHAVGRPQREDVVVYERPDQPDWGFSAETTEDGRFAILSISSGTDRRNRVAFIDLSRDGMRVEPLLMAFDASYDFLGNDGDVFYFRTDRDAPMGKIVAIDRKEPDPERWRTIVPEGRNALQGARMVADRFVCLYLRDACHEIRLFGADGAREGRIDLPGLGAVFGLSGRRRDRSVYFTFASFLHAPAIYRYDFDRKERTVFRQPAIAFDASGFEVERVFPQSKDGTRLCLFLAHRKGLRLDGSHPTYLYGYGGFGISMTPRFSIPNLVWIERGGVLAWAVLRGGGEYGEAWHRAGMLEQKRNVFDDFIACAEYLLRNGYCSRGTLAIGGGSNGGLLVGAVLTVRPDLLGAAIPEVGVLDMLRYHRFTIGWAWASEYGSADDPEQFRWLLRYSPLHNVKPGETYPPTMVMTADHDDRVLPGHSFKFAAALQAAQAGPAPILLRVETKAGHGAGKPVSKQIDEAADRWAFLTRVLGPDQEPARRPTPARPRAASTSSTGEEGGPTSEARSTATSGPSGA
ncbi:MAG: prolyl oligopeptidase family serine peptidase [Planctomycetota bacterium]